LSFLPDGVRSLPGRSWARIVDWWTQIRKWFLPEEKGSPEVDNDEPKASSLSPMERWQSACRGEPHDEFYVFAQYRCYVASEAYINWTIGIDMPPAGFINEKAGMDALRDTLKFKANTANSWILPAIYGALGAAVYSVVRYINVFLADPPLRTSLLRIAFGSFTGITLSMLFGPSSIVMMAEFQTSTTLFLACFLFGYSLDSFLALLRRADSYVNSTFTGPKR
jgi:hypothetical protein